MAGAWLQRTNLWPERTNLRTGSERLRGVANDRAGSSIDRALNFKEIEGWQRRTNVWRRVTNPARTAKRLRNRTANDGYSNEKRCAQCHGKLGLGVRSRNVWNARWWVHVRYCSTHCEAFMSWSDTTPASNVSARIHTSQRSAELTEYPCGP